MHYINLLIFRLSDVTVRCYCQVVSYENLHANIEKCFVLVGRSDVGLVLLIIADNSNSFYYAKKRNQLAIFWEEMSFRFLDIFTSYINYDITIIM